VQTFQASPVTLGGYFTRVAPHHQEILSVFATEAYPLTHPGKTFCQTNGYLREYIHAREGTPLLPLKNRQPNQIRTLPLEKTPHEMLSTTEHWHTSLQCHTASVCDSVTVCDT
jgi:hypothetical protein